jgi:histone-binding protein RBBP4
VLVTLYLKKLSCISGKDKTVVLWSIEDHITSAATDSNKSGGSITKTADSPTVGPRGIYSGHEDTVEDVAFCPSR